MFRRLFWWNLILAVPVVVFAPMILDWFSYSIDTAWAAWVGHWQEIKAIGQAHGALAALAEQLPDPSG